MGCTSFSAFVSLVGIHIAHSAVGLKNCAITAGINKYQSIIKKTRKYRDKVVLLAKVLLAIAPSLPKVLP